MVLSLLVNTAQLILFRPQQRKMHVVLYRESHLTRLPFPPLPLTGEVCAPASIVAQVLLPTPARRQASLQV